MSNCLHTKENCSYKVELQLQKDLPQSVEVALYVVYIFSAVGIYDV